MADFTVVDARILQIIPLPRVMIDSEENLTVGLALCEFTIKWKGNTDLVIKRDVFPIGHDFGVHGMPGDDAFYLLHAFGDIAHNEYSQVAPDDLLENEYDAMIERERAATRKRMQQ